MITKQPATSILGNTGGVQILIGGYPAYISGGSNITLSGHSDSKAYTLAIHGAEGGTGGGGTYAGTNGAITGGSITVNTSGVSINLPAYLTTAQPPGAYLTTAALSNHSHGNPTLALTNLSGTTASASDGLTLSLSAAAPGAGGGVAIADSAQTATGGTVVFANSNRMTFGMSGSSQITGSYLPGNVTFGVGGVTDGGGTGGTTGMVTGSGMQYGLVAGSNITLSQVIDPTGNSGGVTIYGAPTGLTTARASNDAVGLNTAGTNVTWTVNSSGISLNAGAYLTTAAQVSHSHGNPTLALTNLTGTTASASNGFTLSLSAAAPGAGGGVGTNTAQTNVTWTVNTSGISLNAAGYAGTGTSASNASITLNSNGLAISVAAPGGGAAPYVSNYYDHPHGALTSSGCTNSQMSIRRIVLPVGVSFTQIAIPIQVSIGSSAAANTANIVYTSGIQLLTRNGSTLSPIAGVIGNTTHTWASNSANYSSVLGGRFLTFNIGTSLTPGEYYILVKCSTTNNSSIGTATTAIANTHSILFGSTYTALGHRSFGALTADSTSNPIAFMQGCASVNLTATNQTWQHTQITQTGVSGVRANVHVIFTN